jgi:hypothetical protein
MRIEVREGLNHFYAYHETGPYHSIYKVQNGVWYEQLNSIFSNNDGRPDQFLIYERLAN